MTTRLANRSARYARSLLVGVFACAGCEGLDGVDTNDEGDTGIESDMLTSAVTQSFQNGVSPTTAYAGTTDVSLSESAPTANDASNPTLSADRDAPAGSRKSIESLLRFDLGSIPPRSTIQSVKLTVNVTNSTSGNGYELFAGARSWSETQATWQNAAAGTAWSAAGARGAADRGTTALGTLLPTTNGKYTVTLDAAGIAAVQGWVDAPSTNHGFVIDDVTNMDGLAFDSANAPSVGNRPQLSVTYELAPAPSNGTGLLAEYFSGKNFETAVLSRTDATVDFDWGKSAPAAGVPADGFSVRWSGKIAPLDSQTYSFYTTSDDGVRLWVGGKLIIDNWTAHSATENVGTIALSAGQKYDVKLEYFEAAGSATAKLAWSSPTRAKQIVPAAQLFPAAGGSTPPSSNGLDGDGVKMLFPTAPSGATFRLGTQDPNTLAPKVVIQGGVKPIAKQENNIRYWSSPTQPLTYANGSTGYTGRWYIHASGTKQLYTWRTQSGFLSEAHDLKNQEFTAYVRVHQLQADLLPLQFVTLKAHGGSHTSANGDLASCVMMDFRQATTGNIARFGKELTHPNYDYVRLTPKTSDALVENQWVGLKLVSYATPGKTKEVTNRLYVDPTPFTSAGTPTNNWRLFSEYVDVDGVSTGLYDKVVDWGAYETTIRLDGMLSYDVAIFSAREIVP